MFIPPGSPQAASAFQPVALRCDARDNPLGIDTAAPRFSWALQATDSKASGIRQSDFHIFVAFYAGNLAAAKGDARDSGKITSAEQHGVAYAGRTLVSATRLRAETWQERTPPTRLLCNDTGRQR